MIVKKGIGVKSNKAQQIFGLSFGIIFSVILIVFFIVIAFIVIKSFLDVQKCSQIGLFMDKLESEVEKAWNSQEYKRTIEGALPSKIEKVCFADLSKGFRGSEDDVYEEIQIYEYKKANMFFYPIKKSCDMPYKYIEHLNIDKITNNFNENPYCIGVNNGLVNVRVEKELNKPLVAVKIG